MTNILGFNVITPDTSKPWGPKEYTNWEEIIKTVCIGTVTGIKANVVGHQHYLVRGTDGSVAIQCDATGRVALKTGAAVNKIDIDGTLAANSDENLATQKAIKTYVDSTIGAEDFWDRTSGIIYPKTIHDNVGIGTTNALRTGIGTTGLSFQGAANFGLHIKSGADVGNKSILLLEGIGQSANGDSIESAKIVLADKAHESVMQIKYKGASIIVESLNNITGLTKHEIVSLNDDGSTVWNSYGHSCSSTWFDATGYTPLFLEGSSGNIGLGYNILPTVKTDMFSVTLGSNGNIGCGKTGAVGHAVELTNNLYKYTDGNYYRRHNGDEGVMYRQIDGVHHFLCVGIGTTVATLIEPLTLSEDKIISLVTNIGIGTTDPLKPASSNWTSSSKGIHIKHAASGQSAVIMLNGQSAEPNGAHSYAGYCCFVDDYGGSNEKMITFRSFKHTLELVTLNDNATVKDYLGYFSAVNTIFNMNYADIDFIIRSNITGYEAIRVEASSGRIGFGTGTPFRTGIGTTGLDLTSARNFGLHIKSGDTSEDKAMIILEGVGKSANGDSVESSRIVLADKTHETVMQLKYKSSSLMLESLDIVTGLTKKAVVSFNDDGSVWWNSMGADADSVWYDNTGYTPLFLDASSGNIGLGCNILPTIKTDMFSVILGSNGNIGCGKTGAVGHAIELCNNLYKYTDGNYYRRHNGDEGSMYRQLDGVHSFQSCGAGTTVATLTQLVGIGTTQMVIGDAINIGIGTTTGTKIGQSDAQKLGFFGVTPVNRPEAIPDATGAGDVVVTVNTVIARLLELGLLKDVS